MAKHSELYNLALGSSYNRTKYAKGGPGKGVPGKKFDSAAAEARKASKKEAHNAKKMRRQVGEEAAAEGRRRMEARLEPIRARTPRSESSGSNMSHRSGHFSDLSPDSSNVSTRALESDSDLSGTETESDKKGGSVGRKKSRSTRR